jgi:hypothetical protein
MKRTFYNFVTRLIAGAICVVLVGVNVAAPVAADDLLQLLDKGIDYYIPGDVCSGVNAGAPTGGPGSLDGHNLPATIGGTGFEEAINASGQVGGGGFVTFYQNVQNASTAPIASDPEHRSLQDLYRQYYITMRWRYVTWNWNGSSVSPGPETVDFYSKAPKVLVTDKRTGKSIITVVLEAGPAPWTGIDGGSNNNPKQGWVNPQDGTPSTYKGRVSGFPPRAIADLGASMRMSDGSGDDLIYQWAPDQNALPGPVNGAVTLPPGTDPTTACPLDANGGASGDVNSDGFSFPVEDQKKHDYGTLPCPRAACHHDGTPAFDLMYGPIHNMDGKRVYAITGGTIHNLHIYGGVQDCYSIQFQSDLGNGKGPYYYWYGHLQNPKVSANQHVDAGTQIAEVANYDLGSDCRGGRDHLHIDRGCLNGSGVPLQGGRVSCRDPSFVPLMNHLWETLQP